MSAPAEPPASPRIVVLSGPTASGKTALAVELARRLGAEIVNADSQQVYRGLDLGTAKPTAEERAAATHHLLDVVAPGERMDAAHWQALADRAIGEIARRRRLPLIVGGTGLYLRTLLHGVALAPPRDPALRAELELVATREGRPAVHRRLALVDPGAAARIGSNDLVRVVRALEIAAGGRTQSELFRAHGFAICRYPHRLLVLDPPRAELHARIEARLPRLFDGLLAETATLLACRAGNLPERLPIGYAEAALVLAGNLPRPEAERRVLVAHRQYARRQVVWLRREPGAERIVPPVDADALAGSLRTWAL